MTENNSKTDIQLSTLKTVLSMVDTRQRNIESWLKSINTKHRNDEMNSKVFRALRGEYIARLQEMDNLENQIIGLMSGIESKQEEELLTYFQE